VKEQNIPNFAAKTFAGYKISTSKTQQLTCLKFLDYERGKSVLLSDI